MHIVISAIILVLLCNSFNIFLFVCLILQQQPSLISLDGVGYADQSTLDWWVLWKNKF